MIVPMYTVNIFALLKYKNNVLKELQELGVVHFNMHTVDSAEISQLSHELQELELIRSTLQNCQKKGHTSKKSLSSNEYTSEVSHTIASIIQNIADNKQRMKTISHEMSIFSVWGGFDPQQIIELQENNIFVQLATIHKNRLESYTQFSYIRCKMLQNQKNSVDVLVCSNDPLPADFIVYDVPEKSLNEYMQIYRDAANKNDALLRELEKYIYYLPFIDEKIQKINNQIMFHTVGENFECNDEIIHISGYFPKNKLKQLQEVAYENAWGITTDTVDVKDTQVPTLLKNNWFVRLINPILNFIDIMPGYRESEVNIFFLLFFTIFFGMIIGDAGYGILFLLASLGLILMGKAKDSNAPILFSLLSISAIVYGGITGVWFGSELLLTRMPFLKNLIIPSLDVFQDGGNNNFVIYICFTIALIHLLLGRLLNFFREIRRPPYIHAFASIGWACVIIVMYVVSLNMVVDSSYPIYPWVLPLLFIGLFIAFVFDGQTGDGFFKGILFSCTNIVGFALSGIGVFTDVISYIRLYAVGLATFAIAQSFNEMGMGMITSGGGMIIAGLIVLFFAHILNIVLAILGVIVHDVRLNVLEFSSHLGNEWTGIKYKPFKLK